jgi:hypothetical protein
LVLDDLLKDYYVGLLTLMVRRSALPSSGKMFNPKYHIIGDFDLVMRLATLWKIGVIQEPLAVNRIHGSNESLRYRSKHADEIEDWVRGIGNQRQFRKSHNFKYLLDSLSYLRAMEKLHSGRRVEAAILLSSISFGRRFFRLAFGLLLPTSLVRYLAGHGW